ARTVGRLLFLLDRYLFAERADSHKKVRFMVNGWQNELLKILPVGMRFCVTAIILFPERH
ncbi:MAG: hypothetical protein KGI97_08215, partial [Alphaproteobacteria bacterium]|nr:hypothetical protein [Alphaproteobacteria bacterium]